MASRFVGGCDDGATVRRCDGAVRWCGARVFTTACIYMFCGVGRQLLRSFARTPPCGRGAPYHTQFGPPKGNPAGMRPNRYTKVQQGLNSRPPAPFTPESRLTLRHSPCSSVPHLRSCPPPFVGGVARYGDCHGVCHGHCKAALKGCRVSCWSAELHSLVHGPHIDTPCQLPILAVGATHCLYGVPHPTLAPGIEPGTSRFSSLVPSFSRAVPVVSMLCSHARSMM